MLVLTGMNYANKATLYEEAKKSLKKFKGDITEGSASLSSCVKLEPTILAENEEALLAAGYVKQFQGRKTGKSVRGGYNRGGKQCNHQQQVSRKMNPAGADGKTLPCRACGLYRHLLIGCPHRWENLARVNIGEDENVFVRHGGVFVRFSPNRLNRIHDK